MEMHTTNVHMETRTHTRARVNPKPKSGRLKTLIFRTNLKRKASSRTPSTNTVVRLCAAWGEAYGAEFSDAEVRMFEQQESGVSRGTSPHVSSWG